MDINEWLMGGPDGGPPGGGPDDFDFDAEEEHFRQLQATLNF